MDYWHPRVASSPDASEARIRTMPWEHAQEWCNFVLLRPGWLPGGAEVRETVLRPEAPAGREAPDEAGRSPWTKTNRSSYRLVIAAPRGLIRVKQFLYDWAPPAFDHPALWKSEAQPFTVGDRIGWLGTAYNGRPAVSLHAYRTMIELAVEEGRASNQDLIRLCRGMEPVVASARAQIDQTPLAVLAHARRHVDPTVSVPVGYFHHHRSSGSFLHAHLPADAPSDLLGADVARRLAASCPIDSVFVVRARDAPVEVDWVFRGAAESDTRLHLLATSLDGPHAIAVPPQTEPQPCHTQVVRVAGTSVYWAFATDQYGPHEAVWADDATAFMLLARPRLDASGVWFRSLLDTILSRGQTESGPSS